MKFKEKNHFYNLTSENETVSADVENPASYTIPAKIIILTRTNNRCSI